MVTNLILPNDRLPPDVESGVDGGPEFLTLIQTMRNGKEVRIPLWDKAKHDWDVSYGISTKEDFKAVIALFYNTKGRAAAFLFKDWSDYQIGDISDPTGTKEPIIAGDGVTTTRQIFKQYLLSSGAFYNRTIYRIVSGTLSVFVNNILQVEGGGDDYTVDYSTGIITFNSAPGNSLPIEIVCEFDILVRFGADKLGVSMRTFLAGEIRPIIIIAVKEDD